VSRLDELLRLLSETTTLLANARARDIYLVDRRIPSCVEGAMGTRWAEPVPLGRGIAGTVR